MPTLPLRTALVCLISTLLATVSFAPAHAAAPPAEHVFDNPSFSIPKWSTDGKYVASNKEANGVHAPQFLNSP